MEDYFYSCKIKLEDNKKSYLKLLDMYFRPEEFFESIEKGLFEKSFQSIQIIFLAINKLKKLEIFLHGTDGFSEDIAIPPGNFKLNLNVYVLIKISAETCLNWKTA